MVKEGTGLTTDARVKLTLPAGHILLLVWRFTDPLALKGVAQLSAP